MKIQIETSPGGAGCRHVRVRRADTGEIRLTATMDELAAFKAARSGKALLEQALALLLNAPASATDSLPKIMTFLEGRTYLEPEEQA